MPRTEPAGLDLDRVEALERASIDAWPPTHVREDADGWIQRATPGLDRGRSCHALTPRDRELDPAEWPAALARIREWSAGHGIRGGIQASPLELHADGVAALAAAGWEPIWRCWVMVADREEALERGRIPSRSADPSGVDFPLRCADRAEADWLANWELCNPQLPRTVIDAHARTVFAAMDGRGRFVRLGHGASGVIVEDRAGAHAGLFSLVVRDGLRGRGLGRRLVCSLLESVRAPCIYLQVTMDNTVALALYESLGFRAVHSYQHLLAPAGWASTAGSDGD